jgi:hypothetical protein
MPLCFGLPRSAFETLEADRKAMRLDRRDTRRDGSVNPVWYGWY